MQYKIVNVSVGQGEKRGKGEKRKTNPGRQQKMAT